jgi:uncharacterized membrane protein
MDNLQISLALYLHLLTCITVLFYFWNKIINGLVKIQKIRNDSYYEYLARKRNNDGKIQKSNWYETNLEIMKKSHKDVGK